MKRLHVVDSFEDGEKLTRRHLALGLFVEDQPIVGFHEGTVFFPAGSDAPVQRIDDLLKALNRGRVRLYAARFEKGDAFMINGKRAVIKVIGATGQLGLLVDGRSEYLGLVYRHVQDLRALGDEALCTLVPKP